METKISQSQLDVWEWKEKAYKSVQHLPDIMEQLALIHKRTQAVIERIIKNQKSLQVHQE